MSRTFVCIKNSSVGKVSTFFSNEKHKFSHKGNRVNAEACNVKRDKLMVTFDKRITILTFERVYLLRTDVKSFVVKRRHACFFAAGSFLVCFRVGRSLTLCWVVIFLNLR